MAKFYQSAAFFALRAEWEKKLKETGFEDIENAQGGLKKYAAMVHRRQSNRLRESERLEYFRALSTALNQERKMDEIELTVMTMRSNGEPIKLIASENDLHRQTVRHIIRRWEHEWGIRYWTARQRNVRRG